MAAQRDGEDAEGGSRRREVEAQLDVVEYRDVVDLCDVEDVVGAENSEGADVAVGPSALWERTGMGWSGTGDAENDE